jgi:hypothetical protein
MGVVISINGGPTANIVNYSVTEDSTPIDASDSSGGVGQLNFSIAEQIENILLTKSTLIQTNLATNPSLEIDSTGYSANGGTISRTSGGYSGSYSLGITATSLNGAIYTISGLAASQQYYASYWVKGTAGNTVRLDLQELNSSSAVVGTTLSDVLTLTGSWQRISVSRTFGTTGLSAKLFLRNVLSTSSITYWDALLYEVSSTLNSYFDGSSTNTSLFENAWLGATGQSKSTRNIIATYATETSMAPLFINDVVELKDGMSGTTNGIINSISGQDGVVSISGDSRISAFLTRRTVPPFTGTLGAAFESYLNLVGVTAGFFIDSTITSRQVTFPGFVGDMWDFIKKMCAATGTEVSLVSDNIVLRPIRGRIAENRRNISQSWSVSNNSLAQSVEVYYYNNERKISNMVYPKGGWNKDVQIYQVDANEVLEIDIPVDVYLESIEQPTCLDFIDQYYSGPSGAYTISGKDGVPITAAQWLSNGGNLTVAIGEDTRSIIVTITGADDITDKAPYRIAMAADTANTYSTLRIIGTGTHFEQKKLTIITGVTAEKASNLVGTTVDNPFISTIEQAYDAGALAAGKWGSASQTLSVSTVGINRNAESGSINYSTFEIFNATQGSGSFSAFNSSQGSNTFANFTTAQFALVKDQFENQAFGNVAGSRVRFREAWYRIRTATMSESQVSYSAERDTIISEFNYSWAGKTFAQFNTQFTGKLFEDFAVIPLWQT